MLKRLIIGIDPDTSKSGIAFLSSDKRMTLSTFELPYLEDMVLRAIQAEGVNLENIFAIVETPADSKALLNNALFEAQKRRLMVSGMPKSAAESSAFRIALQSAFRAGRCAQVGEEIVKIFQKIGVKTTRVSPSERWRADKPGITAAQIIAETAKKKGKYPSKMSAENFKAIFGFEGRTNEEKRDAGALLIRYFLTM